MSTRSRSRTSIAQVKFASNIEQTQYLMGAVSSCSNKVVWTGYDNDPNVFSGTVEDMTDEIVPQYRKRVAEGDVFFNAMEKIRLTNTVVSGSGPRIEGKFKQCTPPETQWWDLAGGPYFAKALRTRVNLYAPYGGLVDPQFVFTDSDVQSLITRASTECAANRGAGPINLYEDLAQYKQTLNTGTQLYEISSDIFRKIPKPTRIVRGVTSAYLLYRYGLKPLAEDLWQVKQALDVMQHKVRTATRAKASAHQNSSSATFASAYYGLFYQDIGQQTTDDIEVRAMSLDEYVLTRAYEAGLSLKNLETVAWDLIPFSFVCDWFLNIGNVLKAYAPAPNIQSLGGCVTIKRVTSTNYYASLTRLNDTVNYSLVRSGSGSLTATREYKRRIPQLGAPGFVTNWSDSYGFTRATRIADAMALIAQRMTHWGIR